MAGVNDINKDHNGEVGEIIDYRNYALTWVEKVKYALMAMSIVLVFSWLFYGSVAVGVLASGLGVLYLPLKRKALIEERKKKLKQQFREGLYALSSSLSVGKSIEQAFIEAKNDLKIIYWDKETFIIQEFEAIVRKIAMNDTIESALLDFAQRADDEDIHNFTNVFLTAKRTGGNLVEIMKYTTTIINEKIEITEAIDVLVTGKKYEQKILGFMVPGIIIYLHFFSTGFMDVMYQTITGRVAMTCALGIYLISLWIGKKVVEIEV